jgi:glutathione synthase/RimK-type ligase-like ATP-grasp enzyme
MTIRIQPYKQWSGSAKALGKYAGILRATSKQVRKHSDFDYIINWGSDKRLFHGYYINPPEAVAIASNKLFAIQQFDEWGVPQAPWTANRDEAIAWVGEGHKVLCRTLLRANTGRGIVLAEAVEDIVHAPLYTQYVKKAHEYRIHVAFDEVIDRQLKRKRLAVDNEDVNYQIRNSTTGWVFTRDGVDVPSCVEDAAIAAVCSLNLDFGAVDVGYNVHGDTACVYEVNTAPGLEGTTLERYYTAFRRQFPAINGGAYRRRRNGTQG